MLPAAEMRSSSLLSVTPIDLLHFQTYSVQSTLTQTTSLEDISNISIPPTTSQRLCVCDTVFFHPPSGFICHCELPAWLTRSFQPCYRLCTFSPWSRVERRFWDTLSASVTRCGWNPTQMCLMESGIRFWQLPQTIQYSVTTSWARGSSLKIRFRAP